LSKNHERNHNVCRLWLRWTGLSVGGGWIGAVVGTAIAPALQAEVSSAGPLAGSVVLDWSSALVCSGIAGALGQWWVLRARMPRAWRWFLVTAVCTAGGMLLSYHLMRAAFQASMMAMDATFDAAAPEAQIPILEQAADTALKIWLFSGPAAGLVLAVLQWRILSGLSGSGWWVAAAGVSAALAMPAAAVAFLLMGGPLEWVAEHAAVVGVPTLLAEAVIVPGLPVAVAWLVVALPSGIVLQSLLRRNFTAR
jgi:hypothetical protein